MSKEALARIVDRSISDAGFRRQLATDPAAALKGYDLTSDERQALQSGDPGRITAHGIDQRMSKAFLLSQGDASYSALTSSDLTTSGAVQGPDAIDRNAFEATSGGAVQSPDAISRNAFEPSSDAVQSPDALSRNAFESSSGGVQSPDAISRNAFEPSSDAVQSPDALSRNAFQPLSDAMQTPDAADRNADSNASDSIVVGGGEPRDMEPVDISGSEPHDIAPVDIGGTDSFSSVLSSEPRDIEP